MFQVISPELRDALEAFARQESILIALDFDGTLAPLVDDPEASRMIAPARHALVVTGRAIDSVKRVAEPLNEWFLVGSHGIEVLSPGEVTNYETPWLVPSDLVKNFEAVVESHPGTRLEQKPFGLALHTRGVNEQVARNADSAAHQVCEAWGGDLVVRTGHGIVECSIQEATKGDGIHEIRRRLNPTAVLFAGDDRTDEDGFAVLAVGDVAIRVGGGETIAPYRLDDAHAVAEALWCIHDERSSVDSGS